MGARRVLFGVLVALTFPVVGRTQPELLTRALLRDDVAKVKQLLEGGADPNALAEGYPAPLVLAAQLNRLPLVQLLLEHGADPNAKDAQGGTPLHWVCRSNRYSRGTLDRLAEIAEALIAAGADVNAQDAQGLTPLAAARKDRPRDPTDVIREHGGHE